MKRIEFLGRGVLAVIVGMASLLALPASTSAQTTVSVNGSNTSCTAGTTNLTVDSSGNITITCTVSGATVFSCTATATPGSVQSGTSQTSTIQVGNCVNGTAASYAWTIPGTITSTTTGAATAQNFSVTAPAGITSNTNISFPITVTPTSGSPWSGSATLLVTAAAGSGGSSGGTGSCASTNGTFTKNGQFGPITVQQTASVSYAIPYGVPAGTLNMLGTNNFVYFNSVQVPGTQTNLGLEFAISTCQGDFSASVPAGCSVYGTADTSATLLMAAMSATTAAKWGTSCILQPGTQYYLNARMINRDGSNSCSNASCQFIVQSHWSAS